MIQEDELPRSIHGVLGVMSSELNCAICLQLFDDAQTAPCGHVFCRDCIVRALQQRSQCPLCKQPVTRRQLQDSPLGLIAKEFGELRAVYERETGADLSQPSQPPRHETREEEIGLSQQNNSTNPPQLNTGPSRGTQTATALNTLDSDATFVTSQEIQQARITADRQRQKQQQQQQQQEQQQQQQQEEEEESGVVLRLSHIPQTEENDLQLQTRIRRLHRLGFRVTRDLKDATHVVTVLDAAQKASLNHTALCSMLMGIPVVCCHWLEACDASGNRVDWRPYEAKSCLANDLRPYSIFAMARNKLSQQHHKLFSGYRFVLMRDTMDAKQHETLQELIQLGGGRVVSCLDRGPSPQEIIVGRSMKPQEAKMISFGAGRHPLVWHWIINSVGSYDLHKKQPYHAGEGKYCLP